MTLTDRAIRAAKPKDRPYKLTDTESLYLYVSTSGARLWRMNYQFDQKQRTISYGSYPQVTLAEAREKNRSSRRLLENEIDPMEHRKQEKKTKQLARKNTFDANAKDFVKMLEREGRSEATLNKIEWLMKMVRPHIGDRPISEITAPEALSLLRMVEKADKLETARRLRSTMGRIFRHAIASGHADKDPTAALKGVIATPDVQSHPAITDPKKLGPLLRAIDACDGYKPVRSGLRLLPILFPRPGELRLAHWDEFDLEAMIWCIPAGRMKMRRPHKVPLPHQVLDILEELRTVTGHCDLVFPQIRNQKRSMSDGTMNAALKRIGYTSDEVTPHGFRATAATLLNESGLWHPDAIERQLSHQENNQSRRPYARSEHWDERIRMMQWWADYLDDLKKDV
ncbi:tyrosine-type recombinase/integrase [Eilatimonas milleporae]|uniref:Integrase n=1 Tax=Eilatimonas milleporae TaxID=911205 RepID=A0A3M0CE65_9PROT|nr:integrase arm-type DNA-binding domain-containing protein [Eilatimonas milleporae]RMB05036.1 integrase [Eilatimonas milleporae]